MKKSKEILKFAEKVKKSLYDDVKRYNYRIKEPFSAIRTYRLSKFKRASQVHDLLGFWLIVDKIEEIPKIEEKIINIIEENKTKNYNLLEEKDLSNITYSKIKEKVSEKDFFKMVFKDYSKWLKTEQTLDVSIPPYSYTILCKKKFADVENDVPIEFRIQSKEDFITAESIYYTVFKNDTIPLETKIPLFCMCLRLLRRKTNISFSDNSEFIQKMECEINQILDTNKDFINQNKEIFDNVFRENNKLIECWKKQMSIYGFSSKQ